MDQVYLITDVEKHIKELASLKEVKKVSDKSGKIFNKLKEAKLRVKNEIKHLPIKYSDETLQDWFLLSSLLPMTEFSGVLDVIPEHVETCLEIGLARGGTHYILKQISDNVISIDQSAFCVYTVSMALNLIGELDNSYFVIGKSEDEKTVNYVTEILGDRKVDILVIDGNHSEESVIRDFEIYYPLVKNGGYIIMDDYMSRKPVKNAVDKIVQKYKLELTVFHKNKPMHGIALCQKSVF